MFYIFQKYPLFYFIFLFLYCFYTAYLLMCINFTVHKKKTSIKHNTINAYENHCPVLLLQPSRYQHFTTRPQNLHRLKIRTDFLIRRFDIVYRHKYQFAKTTTTGQTAQKFHKRKLIVIPFSFPWHHTEPMIRRLAQFQSQIWRNNHSKSEHIVLDWDLQGECVI